MQQRNFDFLRYGKAIERMMSEWYKYTQEVLQHSGDLGFVREHFVKNVLENFLPRSIIIGSGEIIDSTGSRSGQQDIILYRSDFPVITSFTPVNTYIAEGVIATVEIKSDLSSGGNLLKACQSAQRVLLLTKRAHIISGQPDQLGKLQAISSIKAYVVGYAGWQKRESLISQYATAIESVGMSIPNLLCQPGACVLRNDGLIGQDPIASQQPSVLIHYENPFAVFLFHLLKVIMINTSGTVLTVHGIDAVMNYDLDPYFQFNPPLKFDRHMIVSKESLTE